jgi:transposase
MSARPVAKHGMIRDVQESLPDHVGALHALVAARTIERDAARAECERLKFILHKLAHAHFGASSEQLAAHQQNLALEDVERAPEDEAAQDEKSTTRNEPPERKRNANRGSLPAHLPRVHETIEPEETCCPCCRTQMHKIGEDESQRLDVIPAQLRVLVTHRPKYACRACAGAVVQSPAPERLIKAGLPTEALVAFVLVAKYFLHLPLYRQAQMFALQGVKIDRSTLAFWVGYAARELMPIYARLKEILLASTKISVDETRAPVLDPGRGRTKTGYFWAIARDDRAWSGSDPPGAVFTYAPGRGAEHAFKLLDGFSGVVQCDGYAAYKTLVAPARRKETASAITLAFCWSHWRRRFVEIERTGPAPIAQEALRRIAAIYAIEKTIRGQSAEERRRMRLEYTKPLVDALKPWLEKQLRTVSAKSPIAEAIRYGLKHWIGLNRFLDDGRIELDTNSVENAIRPIALNRKNALFAGHDHGAENWSCIASLIETCRLNEIDPQAYLTEVLTKLVNGWPQNRIDQLMPWAWANTVAKARLAA